MSKTKVVLDHAGFRALLTSPEITAEVAAAADRIAQTAGDGYAASTQVGQGRAVALIYPATYEAARDNRENNTLLKAMQS